MKGVISIKNVQTLNETHKGNAGKSTADKSLHFLAMLPS